MPLERFQEIAGILRCPICFGEVTLNCADAMIPVNVRCTACGQKMEHIAQKPVLVDFSRSLLCPADLNKSTGVLVRNKLGPFRRFMLRHILPYNSRAAINANRFIREAKRLSKNPRILVIGGGAIGSGADALYYDPAIKLVGIDIYPSPYIQVVADAHDLPFVSGCFHAVWIQAVLEHVLDPQRVVDELHRVLLPEGIAYGETPFLQPVHEGAYDFTRFTDSGHRWLFRNFKLIDSGSALGPFAQLSWSLNSAFSALFNSARAGLLVQIAFFWLKYFDRWVPSHRSRDGSSALYFLGSRQQATITSNEIILYYQEHNNTARRD